MSFKLGEKGEEPALKDMANMLGLLHARSANDFLAYRQALAGSDDQAWKHAAKAMATRFEEAYEALK